MSSDKMSSVYIKPEISWTRQNLGLSLVKENVLSNRVKDRKEVPFTPIDHQQTY